jgi:polyisoprenoid-binding protein YceI
MKFLSLSILVLSFTNILALEGKYKLDPGHAKVGFSVSHMVISNVEGRFTKFDGSLNSGKKLSDLKIDVKIDVASVNTDDKDRDDHLKSPDFFDLAKFPNITFESTQVSGTENNLKIKGKLTIKDKTQEVVLNCKLSKEVKDPWGNTRLAITGSTKINRQKFGLAFNKLAEAGPVVGDEVVISISSEAIKEK